MLFHFVASFVTKDNTPIFSKKKKKKKKKLE